MRAEMDFASLQQQMMSTLGSRGVSELESGTIIVLSSLTFPPEELQKILGIQFYEERMLCMLLLLDRPDLEIVYVTSVAIEPQIVDYYLSFLKDPEGAGRRLHLVFLDDARPMAMSQKLLDQPELVDRIASLIPDMSSAYLFPFNVSVAEEAISERLGVPLYGPSPALASLGSKSGSRHVARAAGVPVPEGAEDLWSLAEVDTAIARLRSDNPGCRKVVVKLNNGFSGQGNAIVELPQGVPTVTQCPTVFCAGEESWSSFAAKIEQDGGVVEELLDAPGTVSPSVQLRIFADGTYEVVSTHDQILGGPRGQVYLGCRFPADSRYRMKIQAYGLGIASELARRGVIGSFGIDLLVLPSEEMFLSEINLRLGGTTHPFLMARFATGGNYVHSSGELIAEGKPLTYVATDNLKDDRYVGLEPAVVIAALRDRGIAYDASTKTGVMLHLLGTMRRFGKLGATCIAETTDEADRMYVGLIEILDGRNKN
jgi:hypothetical protein